MSAGAACELPEEGAIKKPIGTAPGGSPFVRLKGTGGEDSPIDFQISYHTDTKNSNDEKKFVKPIAIQIFLARLNSTQTFTGQTGEDNGRIWSQH